MRPRELEECDAIFFLSLPLCVHSIALLTVQLVPTSGEVNAWEFAGRSH